MVRSRVGEEQPAEPGPVTNRGIDGWLIGRAWWVWNLLLFPFVLLYHTFAIYILPCIGTLLERCLTFVFCCVCRNWITSLVLYNDKTFPPNDKTIGQDWLASNPKTQVKWVRACNLTFEQKQNEPHKLALFAGAIEPRDICQGAVGDCWLMSALACMAEFPGTIRKVFRTQELSFRGKYVVRLFDMPNDQWKEVEVDDWLPVDQNNRPIFTKPNGKELWVMILEKAVAKYLGSYSNLDGGHEPWAWHLLTGAHCFSFSLKPEGAWRRTETVFKKENFIEKNTYKRQTQDDYSPDEFWQVLMLLDLRDAIVSASITSESESKRKDGLVAGHAYSVLQAKEVDGFRLLQLRNPWGQFEWTGDWSDKSDLWHKYPSIKSFLNFSLEDDGMFWISFEDFCKVYTNIDVCDRDVSIKDIVLDRQEDTGFWGIIAGCLSGLAWFWCCCGSCRFLYWGHPSVAEPPTLGAGSQSWMLVNEPIKKVKTIWYGWKTLHQPREQYQRLP